MNFVSYFLHKIFKEKQNFQNVNKHLIWRFFFVTAEWAAGCKCEAFQSATG